MTSEDPSRAPYHFAAESWADDERHRLRRSRNIAWGVTAVIGVIAVVQALALVALTPLKSVTPETLLVDRQTGFVQALKPLDAQTNAPSPALIRSFLVQYVIARESFDIATVQHDYRRVALWSAQAARADYVTAMQATSPLSPLARYPRSTLIETRVTGVSPLGGRSAMVRFETWRRDAAGRSTLAGGWVAVMTYRFTVTPLSDDDRLLNPLGFQVVRYRRDAEARVPDVTGS